MDKINKIHKRQLARFLDHLKKTGQLSPGLEVDVKRAFGYVFKDVLDAIDGQDKENKDGKAQGYIEKTQI